MALVKRHQPDVAVFDDDMPGATGLEAFGEARRWSPATRFVILTGRIAPARFQEMEAAGISGILLKSMAPDAICEGIERVAANERVLGEEVSAALADARTGETLTARERQVLEGVARGQSNPQIADVLGVSTKTVESHRTSLMRKLGVRNIASLIVRAVKDGLLTP